MTGLMFNLCLYGSLRGLRVHLPSSERKLLILAGLFDEACQMNKFSAMLYALSQTKCADLHVTKLANLFRQMQEPRSLRWRWRRRRSHFDEYYMLVDP
jgi:hypothetical protein